MPRACPVEFHVCTYLHGPKPWHLEPESGLCGDIEKSFFDRVI